MTLFLRGGGGCTFHFSKERRMVGKEAKKTKTGNEREEEKKEKDAVTVMYSSVVFKIVGEDKIWKEVLSEEND